MELKAEIKRQWKQKLLNSYLIREDEDNIVLISGYDKIPITDKFRREINESKCDSDDKFKFPFRIFFTPSLFRQIYRDRLERAASILNAQNLVPFQSIPQYDSKFFEELCFAFINHREEQVLTKYFIKTPVERLKLEFISNFEFFRPNVQMFGITKEIIELLCYVPYVHENKRSVVELL